MKITIFNGSPRKNGNTASVTSSLMREMEGKASVNEHFLYHLNIKGCLTCGTGTGKDKAMEMIEEIVSSDVVVFASPIYMWKLADSSAALIKLLYSVCRGDDRIADAVENKRTAVILTTDTDENVASDVLVSLRNMCEDMKMRFVGALTIPFADTDKITGAECQNEIKNFASELVK